MGKIVARQNERLLSRTTAQSRRALSTVKDDCGFHFYTDVGNYTGVNATSIQELAERMRTISLDSVKFHFGRGDFQRWIRTIFCDSQLAENIGLISSDFSGEELRQKIVKKIEDRLSELKSLTL